MTKPDTRNADLLREQEDRRIEQEVNRKLSAIMTWDTTDVQIYVNDATVKLEGTVADTKSLEQTVLVVFTVKGVRQIDNKLKIRKDGLASFISRTASDIESMTDDHNEQEENKQ
jgi:osmotically-inducible protein OsmY